MKLSPDQTRIADITFSGDGCVISQAATSVLMDAVVGKSVDEVQRLQRHAVLNLLDVPLQPTRVKCAVLGLALLQAGLYRYSTEQLEPGASVPTSWCKAHNPTETTIQPLLYYSYARDFRPVGTRDQQRT